MSLEYDLPLEASIQNELSPFLIFSEGSNEAAVGCDKPTVVFKLTGVPKIAPFERVSETEKFIVIEANKNS